MVSELKIGSTWSVKEEDVSDDLIIEDRINTANVATVVSGGAFNFQNRDLSVDGTTIFDSTAGEIPGSALGTVSSTDLDNDSVTVAGNSVALGGSTGVAYGDLSDTGSFPIANGDLANDSLAVAGNSVSLGGSTSVDYIDLSDTGSSFPIPNSDLSNSSVTVSAGNQLTGGGSVSLGGSVTVDVNEGSGSGLNADQVDGFDESGLAKLKDGVQAPVYTDLSSVPSGITKGEIIFNDNDNSLYVEDGT